MEFKELFFIASFFLSFMLFALAIKFGFFEKKDKNKPSGKAGKAGASKVLIFSIFLFFSIWSLRFASGFCIVEKGETGSDSFVLEEFVSAFFLSLRTFGIEEEYSSWLAVIKEIVGKMIPGAFWCKAVEKVFVAYVSILDIVAPFASGAIILEFLTSIFPKFQLRLSYLKFWVNKYYYFNELNEASLTMAKSIYEEKSGEKIVLVFADAYVDRENEREYELFLEARRYGAICVRDDLAHIPKTKRSCREYFLLDVDEFANIQSLMGLMEDWNEEYIKGSYIYLFVQSDSYVQIEKQMLNKLDARASCAREGDRPRIVPIYGYRNLVHNLLTEVPLYEPLVSKQDQRELSVTILGNGVIGTEAFLSIYWIGQMLVCQKNGESTEMTPCHLTINVVSKDDEEKFWSKIDYVNPEIQKTVEKIDALSPSVHDDLLDWDQKGHQNKPYCSVRYLQSDLKIGGFWSSESEEFSKVLNAEYFIVALGNDSDNISIAEKIRSYIGKRRIEDDQAKQNKSVIAYAVFDSELGKHLNGNKCFSSRGDSDGSFDIYMHAFGGLEQVYCCDNVYMSKNKIWAEQIGILSEKDGFEGAHRRDHAERVGNRSVDYDNSNYDYWANLARALHAKYKVFSLGWITASIFDFPDDASLKAHFSNVAEICKMFRRLASVPDPAILQGDDLEMYGDLQLKKHCLAWLEHRRWAAFTRTMGYRRVNAKKMLSQGTSHKDMRLKLHSCLVETRFPEISNTYPKGNYKWVKLEKTGDRLEIYGDFSDCVDRLDLVTVEVSNFRGKPSDFKTYDYHEHGVGAFCTAAEMLSKLEQAGVPDAQFYCKAENYKDSLYYETKGDPFFLLPVDSVKLLLAKKYKIVPENCAVKDSFTFEEKTYATEKSIFLARFKGLFTRDEK